MSRKLTVKKKIIISLLILICIVSVLCCIFLLRWYETEPDAICTFEYDEISAGNIDISYNDYRPFGEVSGEKIKAAYYIEIDLGAVHFALVDSDTSETIYESDFDGQGIYEGYINIDGHKNISFIYEKIQGKEFAVGRTKNMIVTTEHTGYYLFKDFMGRLCF